MHLLSFRWLLNDKENIEDSLRALTIFKNDLLNYFFTPTYELKICERVYSLSKI